MTTQTTTTTRDIAAELATIQQQIETLQRVDDNSSNRQIEYLLDRAAYLRRQLRKES